MRRTRNYSFIEAEGDLAPLSEEDPSQRKVVHKLQMPSETSLQSPVQSPMAETTSKPGEISLVSIEPSLSPTASHQSNKKMKSLADHFKSAAQRYMTGIKDPEASIDPKRRSETIESILDARAEEIHTDPIMHVAMEYTIPHLGLNTEFCYGGLGKVGWSMRR